ncbi:MAG TPA: hypothetical protein VEC76_19520 [Streptosporangiaceae bacterium]|nr:hypothetical protein [Streptosporangiaceae bacterium]
MRDGWPAGGLTAACATDEHADCAHRKWLGGGLVSGWFIVDLCDCPCHSACPVKGPGRANLDIWRESCVCPAAGRMRAEEDRLWNGQRLGPPPDMGEIRRQMESRRAARREAVEAVRARPGGKSRPGIRQMLVGEFRSRGLDEPPELILDADVDYIAAGSGPLVTVRQLARIFGALRSAGREIGTTGAIFHDAHRMRGFDGRDPYFVMPDKSRPMVDVVLEPGAGRLLRASDDPVPVSLEPVGPVSDGPAGVRVYVETRLAGTLSPRDAAVYRRALEAAERLSQTLMVMGMVSEGPGETLRMRIYPAGTG